MATMKRGDEVAGISPSFCRAVVEKLVSLHSGGKLWEGTQAEHVMEEGALASNLTPLARALVAQLEQQIWAGRTQEFGGQSTTPAAFRTFISAAEEFLAMFPTSE